MRVKGRVMDKMDEYGNASKINPVSIEGKRLAGLPWYKKIEVDWKKVGVGTVVLIAGVWLYQNWHRIQLPSLPVNPPQIEAEEPKGEMVDDYQVSVEIKEEQREAIQQVQRSLDRTAILLAMIKGHYEAIKTNPNRKLTIKIGGKKVPVQQFLKDIKAKPTDKLDKYLLHNDLH